MHKVAQGIANNSYGINVAELAGIPKSVIKRANDILKDLHQKDSKIIINKTSATKSEIDIAIEKLNLDELTPKSALDFLYKLKTNS
jgi:DNA mismatch repair protein MutS